MAELQKFEMTVDDCKVERTCEQGMTIQRKKCSNYRKNNRCVEAAVSVIGRWNLQVLLGKVCLKFNQVVESACKYNWVRND